jgi:O-antigen ligase
MSAGRLQVAVLAWMAIAGTVMVPVFQARSSAVYPSTAVLALLMPVWAIHMIQDRGRTMKACGLALPLSALVVVAVLSCMQGVLFYDPDVPGVSRSLLVEVYATGLIVLSAGAALVVGTEVRGRTGVRWAYAIVIGVALFELLGSVIPYLPQQRWWPLIVAHGMSLTYAWLLCRPQSAWWLRALAAGFILFALTEVVLGPLLFAEHSQWISGWVMLTIPLAVITLLKVRRSILGLLIPAGLLIAYFNLSIVERVVSLSRAEGDFLRLQIWQDALRILMMRPLLGVGPGNYLDYAALYARGPLFSSAHGDYQQLAAELGLVGLGVILWIAIAALRTAWRLAWVEDTLVQTFAVGTLGALVGQLAASMLGDYLIPAYHNGGHTTISATIYTWIMIGSLMALDRTVRLEAR